MHRATLTLEKKCSLTTQSHAAAHKGLKFPKRFTNLSFDFSRYPGEKGRACFKRKKILRIQLEFCILYMFSLFHPGTHNLSQCQKIQGSLCSDFREVCEPFWGFQPFVWRLNDTGVTLEWHRCDTWMTLPSIMDLKFEKEIMKVTLKWHRCDTWMT